MPNSINKIDDIFACLKKEFDFITAGDLKNYTNYCKTNILKPEEIELYIANLDDSAKKAIFIHKDPNGNTILHSSISSGNKDVAKYLYTEYKKLFKDITEIEKLTNNNQNNILHQAAYSLSRKIPIDMDDIALEMIEDGFSLKTEGKDNETILDKICRTDTSGKIIYDVKNGTTRKELYLLQAFDKSISKKSVNLDDEKQLKQLIDSLVTKQENKDILNRIYKQSKYYKASKEEIYEAKEGDESLSFNEWLYKEYSVVSIKKHNSNGKSTQMSAIYIIENDEKRSKFIRHLNEINDKTIPASCYPKITYDYSTKQKAVSVKSTKHINSLDKKYEEYQTKFYDKNPRTKENIEDSLKLLDEAIKTYDIISKSSKQDRVKHFVNLISEKAEGDIGFKTLSSFNYVIKMYIAINYDKLSTKERLDLQYLSELIMSSKHKHDIKMDANLISEIRAQGSLSKGSISTDLEKVIESDANHLLHGIKNKRIPALGFDSSKEFTKLSEPANSHQDKGGKFYVINVPRFFPDEKNESDTDQIVINAGGMSGHFTIVKIWKQKQDNGSFKYFRTEYNAGAGLHNHDKELNICDAVYTTEINAIDGKSMAETIKSLIIAERKILFYRMPLHKGHSNGESFCEEGTEEAKLWHEQHDVIKKCKGKEVPEHIFKAPIQLVGNCTAESSLMFGRTNISNPNLIENIVHFAQNIANNTNKTIIDILNHKKSELVELSKSAPSASEIAKKKEENAIKKHEIDIEKGNPEIPVKTEVDKEQETKTESKIKNALEEFLSNSNDTQKQLVLDIVNNLNIQNDLKKEFVKIPEIKSILEDDGSSTVKQLERSRNIGFTIATLSAVAAIAVICVKYGLKKTPMKNMPKLVQFLSNNYAAFLIAFSISGLSSFALGAIHARKITNLRENYSNNKRSDRIIKEVQKLQLS